MATRDPGTFIFSANLEVKIKGMLDARGFAKSYEALLSGFTADNYLMNGFPVIVWDEDESKRGWYQLINENDLSNPESWKMLGGNGVWDRYTDEEIDNFLIQKADLVDGKVPREQLPTFGETRIYTNIPHRDADDDLEGVSFGYVIDASADNNLPEGQRDGVMYANTTGGWAKFNVEAYDGIYNKNGIPAELTLGGFTEGETFLPGQLWETFAAKLLSFTHNPKLVPQTYGLSDSAAALEEIGRSLDIDLVFDFNRGQILGSRATPSSPWNPTAKQNDLAGAATSYKFMAANGAQLVSHAGNTFRVEDHVVAAGVNLFKATVSHAAGPQPKNSKGQNFGTPLAAQTSPEQVTSFEGVMPFFATSASIDTLTKQNLVGLVNGGTIVFLLAPESKVNGTMVKQRFAAPGLLSSYGRSVVKVEYFNGIAGAFDLANKIGDFNITDTTQIVQGVEHAYKLFTYKGLDRGPITVRLTF